MTQRDLAEASRVPQPNIAAFENGSRRPSAQMLERLHAAARPRPSTAPAQHRSEVERVLREHKAVSAKVFGSVARDEDRPGSDLDLLVAFETGASLFDQVGLAQDLEDLLGVHVDVLSEGGLTEQHAEIRAEARRL